ncbi:4-hydroxy-3-methylbut-2-enyl diphosphate reductase [Chthonomonas calidirosea]|uniref:4-hydroxy-3-methylbut-2-enyl diphosphate reductase n=1 Tax=Chthonomonas calidirosea TaxID=454171 RepID=UPI0006EC6478|nr:4-hydroxy-3-methylbut-2-enyl diphosphate reductase [Chthonomonas calidirosea]CEK15225.1 4-hydroxy-3-methylbut-2-enyl diphosphate reductase [Chthonomonas calidirosea]
MPKNKNHNVASTPSGRTVIMASEVGFCFGVKRAINLTRQALDERKDVFILGDLVHNKRVTDELESKGLRKVEDYTQSRSGTMVIRAHGLPKAKIEEAKMQGIDVVDATCPIVLRAQEAAQILERDGYQVVIIGDKNHAEIKGILGSLENPALVIDSVEELHEAKKNFKLLRKVGVIFQTTHALELCHKIINEMLMMCKEIRIINTICRPVQNRQDDAIELAQKVDLMIVVGSRTSANTMELAALCRHYNPNTIHVQNAEELPLEALADCKTIGIASGLSTPEDLVEAVRQKVLSCDIAPPSEEPVAQSS